MKRSEMIRKIAEITEKEFFPISEDSVHEIILLAERFGMLPPGHGNSGMTVKDEDFYIPIYKWEKE